MEGEREEEEDEEDHSDVVQRTISEKIKIRGSLSPTKS